MFGIVFSVNKLKRVKRIRVTRKRVYFLIVKGLFLDGGILNNQLIRWSGSRRPESIYNN